VRDESVRVSTIAATAIMVALIPIPDAKHALARNFPVPHDHLRRPATILANCPGPAYD